MTLWRRNGATAEWESEAFLEGIDKPGNGIPEFGSALAGVLLPSGEEVVFVGAQNGGDDPTGGAREGSAYAFVRAPGPPPGPTAWTMEARLLGPATVEGDRFGTAVALLATPGLPGGHPGDVLALVGADQHTHLVDNHGAVFAYLRDGASGSWIFETLFRPADAGIFEIFGSAVAVLPLPDGEPGEALALVGATYDNRCSMAGTSQGAAYAFRRERDASAPSGFVWVEEAKLCGAMPRRYQHFGSAVALAADTLTSGTSGDDTPDDGTPVAMGLIGGSPEEAGAGHPSVAELWRRTVDGSGEPEWSRAAVFRTGAAGGGSADWFGHSVAFAQTATGPLALVGAYYSDAAKEQGYPGGEGAGAVFVYDGRATVAAEPGGSEPPALPGEPSGAGLTVSPNPVQDRATVTLTLSVPGQARVSVVDVLGRHVVVLHDGVLAAGEHSLAWVPGRLARGVYVVRLEGAAFRGSRTVTVVR